MPGYTRLPVTIALPALLAIACSDSLGPQPRGASAPDAGLSFADAGACASGTERPCETGLPGCQGGTQLCTEAGYWRACRPAPGCATSSGADSSANDATGEINGNAADARVLPAPADGGVFQDLQRPDLQTPDVWRAPADCTGPDGQIITNGSARTYYAAARAEQCATVAEERHCTDGRLSGSYSLSNCNAYRYHYGPWNSSLCAITTLREYLDRRCLRDDGVAADCGKCGGECSGNRPCSSCAGGPGVNIAAANSSQCADTLATMKTNCASLGCRWTGAQICTQGGTSSCTTCWGAVGNCVY